MKKLNIFVLNSEFCILLFFLEKLEELDISKTQNFIFCTLHFIFSTFLSWKILKFPIPHVFYKLFFFQSEIAKKKRHLDIFISFFFEIKTHFNSHSPRGSNFHLRNYSRNAIQFDRTFETFSLCSWTQHLTRYIDIRTLAGTIPSIEQSRRNTVHPCD